MPVECAMEMKAKDKELVHNLLVTDGGVSLSQIINCEDYSSIHRLLRVTAYVLRFVVILKRRSKNIELEASNPGLKAVEIQ